MSDYGLVYGAAIAFVLALTSMVSEAIDYRVTEAVCKIEQVQACVHD